MKQLSKNGAWRKLFYQTQAAPKTLSRLTGPRISRRNLIIQLKKPESVTLRFSEQNFDTS